MSRTVRRRHDKSTNKYYGSRLIPDGFKIAGYYTQYDYHSRWAEPEWDGPIYTYREPTKEERYKTWNWLHGESSNGNERSPGRSYRNARMRENRSINKQELIRWMKNPDDHEPLFEDDPRSCRWDWR